MSTEEKVARHYTHGSLEKTILDALIAAGKDIEHLRTSDLRGVDEFHLGRHEATVAFGKDLDLVSGARLLDIGSGLGGPARYFAETYDCEVSGIDLTDEFVNVANVLTARCEMASRVSFQRGSALALPFTKESFDRVTLLHVGMNIEDKAGLFAQVRRVLKRGGRFGIYDIMKMRDSALPYPMPWSMTTETSFVEPQEVYRRLLSEAGFTIELEQDRTAIALRVAQEMRAGSADSGIPLPGFGSIMGVLAAERMANVAMAVQNGLIAPIEMIARVD